jgi:hypothetical protein
MQERLRIHSKESLSRCPYCHENIVAGGDEAKSICDFCLAVHHSDCMQEYGRCAACKRHLETSLQSNETPQYEPFASPEQLRNLTLPDLKQSRLIKKNGVRTFRFGSDRHSPVDAKKSRPFVKGIVLFVVLVAIVSFIAGVLSEF